MDSDPNITNPSGNGPRTGMLSSDDVTDPQDEIARLRQELAAARATIAWHTDAAISVKENGVAGRLALLEAMLETAPVGVVLADATGRIIHGNAWVERNLGHPVLHSADTDSYGEWVSFHADGRRVESHEYPLSRVIRDGEDHSQLDVHYRRADGTMFWKRIEGKPVRDANGKTVGATVALVDIDDEVRLLEEKEILLGEVNHRVKNSLQLVGSILSLQARTARPEAATLLQSASARVQAIASVHAALYHDDDVRTVEFGDYLRRFCATLADGLGAAERGITLHVEAEKVILPADKAVPLSLVINELVTNSFKYAFSNGSVDRNGGERAAPRIDVWLGRNDDGKLIIEVADNGCTTGTESVGHASDAEASNTAEGLGTKLTAILARQLEATITIRQADGWIVRLELET
jgi:PAS domain S-box-containing protein